MIPGYDDWKTDVPEDPEPVAHCNQCGEALYEGDVLHMIDGGICEKCLEDEYKLIL